MKNKMLGITPEIMAELRECDAILEIRPVTVGRQRFARIRIHNYTGNTIGTFISKEQFEEKGSSVIKDLLISFKEELAKKKSIYDKCFKCRWALFDGDGIHCQLGNLKNAENCNLFESEDE